MFPLFIHLHQLQLPICTTNRIPQSPLYFYQISVKFLPPFNLVLLPALVLKLPLKVLPVIADYPGIGL